ncbi:MAG: DUF4388 domain-containing protein [Thermodesulfovibrionales bacterium]|nr:DUF4388 domain-containing protein [Thermodesulfovibrionales bacterium]
MSLVGRLEDLALSDIFQILSIGKKTGTLLIRGRNKNAFVVFKNGLVVRAESDTLGTNLGEDLMKDGFVSHSILNLALETKRLLPEKSIADILFDLGAVTREVLDRASKKRIERVVFDLMQWQDGDFEFELDILNLDAVSSYMDTGWEVSKGLSPEYLLMEGARVYDETQHQEFIKTEEIFPTQESKEDEEEWFGRPPEERKDISQLRALSVELRFPSSASEITLLILRFASDIFQRGVLFMVDDEEILGLGQFGLEIEAADEKIRKVRLNFKESDFLRGIINQAAVYKGQLRRDSVTERFISLIGGGWPKEVAFFPIIAEQRVVAMLYCDNAPGNEPFAHTEGLEIFINQAGLALEKALLERRLRQIQDKD